MFKRLPSVIWGDEDSDGTWAFEVWKKAIKRANTMTGGSFVFVLDRADGGRTMQVHRDQRIFVMLSGSSNPYTAQEVYPTPSGGWVIDPTSPTLTDVYEDNGTPSLGGNVFKIRRDIGEWRFRDIRVGPTSGRILAGCNCALADTLFMTQPNPLGGPPITTPITWQPTPSAYSTLGIGADGYFTNTTFTDLHGTFQWHFLCAGANSYRLEKVYASFSPGGHPARGDFYTYATTNGGNGNTCVPFNLQAGFFVQNGVVIITNPPVITD